MTRSLPWGWIGLAALLLILPGPAGRLLLDVLGGLTLTILLLPLLAGAAALIGWQVIRRQLRTCPACGVSSLATSQCPACGTVFNDQGPSMASPEVDASSATITVEAVDVAPELDQRRSRQP